MSNITSKQQDNIKGEKATKNTKSDINKGHVHTGHRERLKNRFHRDGLQSFEPHMVLELLLFYAVVQKDTNEIGHRLLAEFGSFSGVVDADITELMKVPNISKNVATLIKLIPHMSQYYFKDKASPKINVSTPEELAQIVLPMFVSKKNECVLVVCMSNDYKLVAVEQISDGGMDFCMLKPRLLVQAAIKHNVSNISIAHNHMSQGGVLMPSIEDIKATRSLIAALEPLEISLFDHIIVSGEKHISIMRGVVPYIYN